MDDLKAWIIHGIQEEDPHIKAISLEIKKAEKCVKTLTSQLMELGGIVLPGVISEAENNVPSADQPEADVTVRLKKEAEVNLEKCKNELKVASEVYENVKVTLKSRAVSEEMRDFFVTFTPREKNGITFEDVVIGKNNWTGLKLSVSHNDNPTWVGRGRVPNGTSAFDVIDYRPYQANMHKVEFFQRKHGFGCEVQVETSQCTKKLKEKKTVEFVSQVVDSPSEYSSIDDQQQPNTLGNDMEKNKALLGNETILYRGHYK